MKEAFDKTTRLVAEEALLRKGSGGGGRRRYHAADRTRNRGAWLGCAGDSHYTGNEPPGLTTSGGVAAWETPAAGITQLTGQVTAGPGLGSEAATIALRVPTARSLRRPEA